MNLVATLKEHNLLRGNSSTCFVFKLTVTAFCLHVAVSSQYCTISQGPFFKKNGILKVCKAFLSIICHAAVFTQFGYADSKSAPCQALILIFSHLKLKNKMAAKIAE